MILATDKRNMRVVIKRIKFVNTNTSFTLTIFIEEVLIKCNDMEKWNVESRIKDKNVVYKRILKIKCFDSRQNAQYNNVVEKVSKRRLL